MSKNRNYNRYYNNEPKETEVETTEVEEVVEEPEAEEEEVIEEEPETVVEEAEREPLYEAVVDGCEKLRVRSEDKLGDNIVTTIEKGDRLYILSDNKDSEFYVVQLEDGTLGFCMKKFVEILEEE